MQARLANLLLFAAALASLLAVSQDMLILATNDMGRYRPVLLWAAGFSAASVVLSFLFALICAQRYRVLALGPIVVALLVLLEVAQRWPRAGA